MSKQWKLVPVDPTTEMEEAFAYSFFGGWSPEADPITDALKAMIEVIPAAPAFGDAIALSESTRDDLQELINGATQCEEADVDYEFANEIGQLLDPVYSNAYVLQLKAEIQRLRQFETAVKIWDEKTEWVQKSVGRMELGRHRADILRDRIAAASVERTPKDYAIEHAEYLAQAADHVQAHYQAYSLAQMQVEELGDDAAGEFADAVDAAREDLHEGLANLRSMVYEFRKRKARADDVAAGSALAEREQGIPGTSFQRLNQLANEGE